MISFANPLFLLALAGLALPVIIHRISRAKPRPWLFPSISYIRATPLPRQGKRRISDWLLLLLRMLLFTLIILALAGPRWTPNTAGTNEAKMGQTVILVDYSASMAGWGAREDTLNAVENIFSRTKTTEKFGYIIASDTILWSKAARDTENSNQTKGELTALLEENEPKTVVTNAQLAIKSAIELFKATGPRKLVVISDFQQNDWNDDIPEIPEEIEVELFKVGQTNRAENLAIFQTRTVPTQSDRINVVAEVMNFSRLEKSTTVTLETSAQSQSKEISIPPESSTTVAFEFPLPSTPSARLYLNNNDDPYPLDDSRFFWAAPPPPVNLLSLLPMDSSEEDAEEVFFLDQALSSAGAHEWISFSTLSMSGNSLTDESLQRAGAVFLPANQASQGNFSWELLEEYVRKGGLLIVSLGNNSIRTLQQMFKAGMEMGRYNGLAGKGRDLRLRFYVGEIPTQSPFASVFKDEAARDLYLLTINNYTKLADYEEAQPLLFSEEGNPLLLKKTIGKGNLVLSTFPWNRFGSDLPLRPSFLPIVREIVGLSLNANSSILQLDTYQAFPSNFPESTNPPSTSQPAAFYYQGIPVVVNITRSESNPATIDVETFNARLRPLSQERTLQSSTQEATVIQLAKWVLLCALVLWILETVVASYYSRTSSTRT